MLFSRLALLFVLIEWAGILYGYFGQSAKALYHLFIHGSPITLAINLFNQGSALLETTPIIVVLLVFHILKYACIFKAQVSEDRNGGLMTAILLEILYLAYSGYLLY